ncbi:AT-hook motif nuclear-localized protein 10-like [Phalaenopsis equestris]|uniref:AT-hook motif nuclear-localized protein 10-like n=1 Tax=Phalaenopsis equestris TaxID=78828 RepID=UPI0009E213B7|nr:AT-hook motif nuclear-localized protein 10-like [Phalaenopsis equestris]
MSGAAGASPSLVQESPSSSSRKKETKASNSLARKAQLTALGNAGQGFTPHVITVSAGEDLVNKLVSVMQQGKRAVCVLSATGSILNPSFRQPASSSSNDTYDGMFDIISLSGALTYAKDGGTVSRTGGLGICLSGVDGRIVGGGVEGPLIAAGPVQVIAGSFLIDIDRNFSASRKEDDCTNKLSTEAAARATFPSFVHVESNLGSLRRVTSSRGSENYQRMGESYHLFPSRPLFPSPDWDGPANP